VPSLRRFVATVASVERFLGVLAEDCKHFFEPVTFSSQILVFMGFVPPVEAVDPPGLVLAPPRRPGLPPSRLARRVGQRWALC